MVIFPIIKLVVVFPISNLWHYLLQVLPPSVDSCHVLPPSIDLFILLGCDLLRFTQALDGVSGKSDLILTVDLLVLGILSGPNPVDLASDLGVGSSLRPNPLLGEVGRLYVGSTASFVSSQISTSS